MQDPFGWGHISSILWYARRIQMVDILFSPFPSSTWTETMCKKGTVGRWLHFTYCKCFERQDTYPLTHICYSWTYSCYLLTYHRWPLVERFSLYTLLNAVQSGSRLILAKQGPKYTSRTPVIQWFEDSCFVWNANDLVPFQPFGLSGATDRVLETSSNKRCKKAEDHVSRNSDITPPSLTAHKSMWTEIPCYAIFDLPLPSIYHVGFWLWLEVQQAIVTTI